MKVLLVAAPIMDRVNGRLIPIAMDAARDCPPYGVYLLATILKQLGHEVVIADLIASGSEDLKPYQSELEDCSLVGISATSLSWPTAIEVINQLRQFKEDIPIALGGIHPTIFDRYILKTFPVQYIIRGEGEIALPALCDALSGIRKMDDVPNLSRISNDGNIVRNPAGPHIPAEGISSFPLPDYEMLPPGIYQSLAIESSRGCAFDCSFCSTSYRKSWRGIPAEIFVDRLEEVMDHLNLTTAGTVHIIDDEFSTNTQRATEIAQLIRKRGLDPQLVYDSRAKDLLNDNFVKNIAEYTHQFLVGAECGYDEGLKRAGKGTTCEILENAALKLNEYGISGRADFSFIISLPWETRREVEKTIRFAMHLFSKYGVRVLLQWYCQIPGSRLWDEARNNQVLNESMYDEFGFFRNLYLFRSGVKLSPKEIWEIGDLMMKLGWVSNLSDSKKGMIEFGFPEPIAQYFPRDLLSDDTSSLANLRELSKPLEQIREAVSLDDIAEQKGGCVKD